jgi:hypothetical protein
MRTSFSIALSLLICSALLGCATSNEKAPEPEYTMTSDNPEEYVPTSPKQPWGEFTPTEEHGGHPWWAAVLLWAPNRVLDLIDIFRVDIGVGPAVGAVVRITEYGQVGYRQMMPVSLRVGDFGRKFPAIVEHSNELGIGPAFLSSGEREVCTGELGLGADLLLVGGYGGICVEEFADFLAGLIFFDIMEDDL